LSRASSTCFIIVVVFHHRPQLRPSSPCFIIVDCRQQLPSSSSFNINHHRVSSSSLIAVCRRSSSPPSSSTIAVHHRHRSSSVATYCHGPRSSVVFKLDRDPLRQQLHLSTWRHGWLSHLNFWRATASRCTKFTVTSHK